MSNDKYKCPSCNSDMCWTGNVRQIGRLTSDIAYIYKCIRCGYKSDYKRLTNEDCQISSTRR